MDALPVGPEPEPAPEPLPVDALPVGPQTEPAPEPLPVDALPVGPQPEPELEQPEPAPEPLAVGSLPEPEPGLGPHTEPESVVDLTVVIAEVPSLFIDAPAWIGPCAGARLIGWLESSENPELSAAQWGWNGTDGGVSAALLAATGSEIVLEPWSLLAHINTDQVYLFTMSATAVVDMQAVQAGMPTLFCWSRLLDQYLRDCPFLLAGLCRSHGH